MSEQSRPQNGRLRFVVTHILPWLLCLPALLAVLISGPCLAQSDASPDAAGPAPAIPYMDYLDSAQDVDHAVEVTFVPRNWSEERLARLITAWKAIIEDTYRPPVKLIFSMSLAPST